jgi:hypothetical protein
MHEGGPFDLENAAKMMADVQTQIEDLNRNFQHIKQLTVIGMYGDALMILSPIAGQPNLAGTQLLRKTDQIVFKPGEGLQENVAGVIQPWECGKIDKFLADNMHLTICFQDQRFELSDKAGKLNIWDPRPGPDPDDNGFSLEHRRRVTLQNPTFVVEDKRGGVYTDYGVDPARQLARFGRVVA